jgi:GNAT superfamily N-acetyltransferase
MTKMTITRTDDRIRPVKARLSRHAVSVRVGSLDDAEPAGAICYQAFKMIAEQHAFPPDFPTPAAATELMQYMLSRSHVHAVVAEVDGQVVGSNFLWKTGFVAGVGPITVDPVVQNSAIGRRLMEAVLEHAREQGIAAVRLLQAAYHARSLSLYTKLGFVVREPLAVLQGERVGLQIAQHYVRAASETDVDPANALSQKMNGYDRAIELREAVRQGTAKVVEREGRITGYATDIGFFGHAVGETLDDVKAMIAAASSVPGPGFMVPMRDAELLRWCLEQGLRVVQPMTLMSIGPYAQPKGTFLPSILY